MPRHEHHHRPNPEGPHGHPHFAHGVPPRPQSSWEIPALSFAALKDFFDSDEETAAAQVAFARGPEELRVAANLAVHLPTSTREERQAHNTSSPPIDTGAFFGNPSGLPFNGVPLPSIDEVAEVTGDAALAHRCGASLTRQVPEEIRALIVMLVRAGMHERNAAVENGEEMP